MEKKAHKNIRFKISATTQNEELELPDRSYSFSDTQYCFEYLIKKHETLTKT